MCASLPFTTKFSKLTLPNYIHTFVLIAAMHILKSFLSLYTLNGRTLLKDRQPNLLLQNQCADFHIGFIFVDHIFEYIKARHAIKDIYYLQLMYYVKNKFRKFE